VIRLERAGHPGAFSLADPSNRRRLPWRGQDVLKDLAPVGKMQRQLTYNLDAAILVDGVTLIRQQAGNFTVTVSEQGVDLGSATLHHGRDPAIHQP
jgi:hypothetical protein